jgi:hypothetical protein
MSRRLRRRLPSPSIVVAVLALVVSMGGTGYAALNLPAGSVGPRQIRHGAVTSAKVKDRTLRRGDFAAGQLPRGVHELLWVLVSANEGHPVIEAGRGARRVERVSQLTAGIVDVHFNRVVRNCSVATAPFQEAGIVSAVTSHDIENIDDDVVRVSFWNAQTRDYTDRGLGYVTVFC